MKNQGTALKKFLSNKNTVTFLCIILGVIVLFVGYNYRVNKATNPVQIPYAKKSLDAKTKISASDVGLTNVPQSLVKTSKTILTNTKDIINKYVTYTSGVAKNSYFYQDSVIEEEELPDYAFMNMPDGYLIYSLKVNMATTYANKIMPNTYIDLYASGKDTTINKNFSGILVKSIKVKAVKDSNGNALLENGVNNGTPAAMLFEVTEEDFDLLKKAEYTNVSITPIPRNENYTIAAGETSVDNDTIKNYILSNCENIK